LECKKKGCGWSRSKKRCNAKVQGRKRRVEPNREPGDPDVSVATRGPSVETSAPIPDYLERSDNSEFWDPLVGMNAIEAGEAIDEEFDGYYNVYICGIIFHTECVDRRMDPRRVKLMVNDENIVESTEVPSARGPSVRTAAPTPVEPNVSVATSAPIVETSAPIPVEPNDSVLNDENIVERTEAPIIRGPSVETSAPIPVEPDVSIATRGPSVETSAPIPDNLVNLDNLDRPDNSEFWDPLVGMDANEASDAITEEFDGYYDVYICGIIFRQQCFLRNVNPRRAKLMVNDQNIVERVLIG